MSAASSAGLPGSVSPTPWGSRRRRRSRTSNTTPEPCADPRTSIAIYRRGYASLPIKGEVIEDGHTVGFGPHTHGASSTDVCVIQFDPRFAVETYPDVGAREFHTQ